MADILGRIDAAAKVIDKISSNVEIKPVITSISSQAAKSTYYFPVLVSKNVAPKTATLISTNLEYMYAYFMRACFALTPAIRVNGDVNVDEYLKRFHQNVGINRNKFGIVLKEDMEEFRFLPNSPLNEIINTNNSINEDAKDTEDDKDDKNNKKKTELETPIDMAKNAKNKITNAVDELTGFYHKTQANISRWDSSDIKKSNDITPTIMAVTCEIISDVKSSKGDAIKISVSIPIGIKTVIHGEDPMEINDRIIDSISGHGVIKSLVRWSSGEVESLGDMLFGTTKMKQNISGDRDLDKWFDIIERRKRINKLSLGLSAKKPFLPNMTIHLSMDDVIDIERKTKINLLKNVSAACRLVKDCFLLAFVITDDAYETAYVLYDGHADFDEVPYNTIKRDNDKQSSAIDNLAKVLMK